MQSRATFGAFDPETIRILSVAFEDACQSLSGDRIVLGPDTDAMRDALARSIIDVAADGERDRCRLRDEALARLARALSNSSRDLNRAR
jgi:hypothetical protein